MRVMSSSSIRSREQVMRSVPRSTPIRTMLLETREGLASGSGVGQQEGGESVESVDGHQQAEQRRPG